MWGQDEVGLEGINSHIRLGTLPEGLLFGGGGECLDEGKKRVIKKQSAYGVNRPDYEIKKGFMEEADFEISVMS